MKFDFSIKYLLKRFDYTPRFTLMIICLGLTGIAFVVDTMLTYTFPAYTLIGLIILLTVFSVKTYEKYRHRKMNERYNKNQYMD